VSSANFALNRTKNILPVNVRKLIYNSLVKSHIEYGIIAYGGVEKHRLNRIKNLQKKAVRNVALGSRFSHTDPTFGKLEILKIDDLYSINVGVFMHKYLSSKLPISFSDMFKFFPEPNRTRNFVLEQTKQKRLDSLPKVSMPKVWNNYDISLKTACNVNSFKSMFRTNKFLAYKSFQCREINCYSCLN